MDDGYTLAHFNVQDKSTLQLATTQVRAPLLLLLLPARHQSRPQPLTSPAIAPSRRRRHLSYIFVGFLS